MKKLFFRNVSGIKFRLILNLIRQECCKKEIIANPQKSMKEGLLWPFGIAGEKVGNVINDVIIKELHIQDRTSAKTHSSFLKIYLVYLENFILLDAG